MGGALGEVKGVDLSIEENTKSSVSFELRQEVRDFYERYFDCLDRQDVASWPNFFHRTSRYTVQSVDSHKNNFRICDIFCDNGDMIIDRARALASTALFEVRYQRRFIGGLFITSVDGGELSVRCSYMVVETVADEPAAIFSSGQSYDTLLWNGDQLLFAERTVAYDQSYIKNTLVFPL